MNRLIHFCLHQKLVVFLLLVFFVAWGIRVAPFDWDTGSYPRDPVAVDAIPDLGDNQQIIFTEWPGRSPRDVEDQITYPLTVALLGVPGVEEVRSSSMFGYSYVYLIFEEDREFYWSRSRILEKLNSLPANLLPKGVTPTLGPDATGLGQIFWYVLEGRDPRGNPAAGWDPDELRALQDWQVRYALLAADGVADVASVGGFQRQYQVDVDPDALRAHQITLAQVADAVRQSNQEIGARNLAVNGVEYFLRGTGYVETIGDLEKAVVAVRQKSPITVADLATVKLGPAMRRGVLDVNGADAAGGVVIARYGANPLAAIQATKDKIRELSASLPVRPVIDWTRTDVAEVTAYAREHGIASPIREGPELNEEAWLAHADQSDPGSWPAWFTTSKVTVVPFYDRSSLIGETLNTLDKALFQQVLVSIVVVVILLLHLRSSLLISMMLPLAVLITFIAMKLWGVDANIVALAGIAIAIGTVVDVGIILTENILKHLDEADPEEAKAEVIFRGVTEVAGAVTTSVVTTVVSFLPVFTMTGEAGRLFTPLAFTKTFALSASLLVALTIIPPVAHLLFGFRFPRFRQFASWRRSKSRKFLFVACNLAVALGVTWLLARDWMPLGFDRSTSLNLLFVGLIIGALLLTFKIFERCYEGLLTWCLNHKALFLSVPLLLVLLAFSIWLGFPRVFAFLPGPIKESRLFQDASETFPGLGEEFRPALDEGSFLFMPTVASHVSIGEAQETLQQLDAAIASIPEVERVAGKIGRAETPLDPAPLSMIETVVQYVSEFKSNDKGDILRFQTNSRGDFVYENGSLVPDPDGKPFRQWRPHIQSPDDIWAEISEVTRLPGVTGAPKLQPIETRLVMLRTGMRAPMGIKIKGPNLEAIEDFGLAIEENLRSGKVPGLDPATVNADRIVGKPYLEIIPDREAASRYGLNIADVHDTIQTAIGGRIVTTTVEGRERFEVQVRYPREKRDSLEDLRQVLVTSKSGEPIPLSQLASVQYLRGPQHIKAEDTFLTGHVTFGARAGYADVDVVEAARTFLAELEEDGQLRRPSGVRYEFAGSYQAALESNRTLMFAIPLCLGIIFMILYLDHRSVTTTAIVFSGVAVAWAGGFLLLWLYGQPGFLNIDLFGHNLADLFQINPVNLSVAVWVGFLALFGIATDDGVVMSTYLRQKFKDLQPQTITEVRQTAVAAGKRRVRPCLMTTATTLLALLPVLTSTGRGADLMAPMAIPIFGGMMIELLTMFVVPVLYCLSREVALRHHQANPEKKSKP